MNLAGIENREPRRNNQESSLRFSTRLSILDSREDRESSVNLLLNSTVLMYFLLADADRKLPSKDKGSPCEYAVRFSSYKKKIKRAFELPFPQQTGREEEVTGPAHLVHLKCKYSD